MLTAILELTFRPDDLDASLEKLYAILTDTRAFDGNHGIEVLVDVADPTRVRVVERWESAEHDAAYRAWRATDEGRSGLPALLTGPPTVLKLETTRTL